MFRIEKMLVGDSQGVASEYATMISGVVSAALAAGVKATKTVIVPAIAIRVTAALTASAMTSSGL